MIVGIVRRPDPEPCYCCSQGRWDMCENGRFGERGIKGLDGYASEYYCLEPAFAIGVPESLGLRAVLVEPTSVVVKAWRRVMTFAQMNCRSVESVLIAGAGPIGLLAALLGRLNGLEVHVLDRATEGPKPDLVTRLGASYHTSLSRIPSTDVLVECTGAAGLIPKLLAGTRRNSIVCLTGVTEPTLIEVDIGKINNDLVLENGVVLGSVNASRDDYEEAVRWLRQADQAWLEDLLKRRVPIDEWHDAYELRDHDVKTVIVW